jgi:hypothetical protein
MNEQTNTVEQSTPEVAIADMSLAEYRATRTPAEAKPEAPKEEAPAGADDAAGEDDAQEGGADDTEHSGEAVTEDGRPAQKKKGGFQRKIEQKDREIEDLRRQLADKSAANPAEEQPKPEAVKLPEFTKPKPKLEDFDSVEEHTDALTDWKLEKRDFEADARKVQEKARSEAQTLIDAWNTRQAAAKETHADYDDVLKTVEQIKISPAHQRLILESEHGPELAYQLAQKPDELKKFAGMQSTAAAKFIGRLEASLGTAQAAAPNEETKVSNAPKPMRTLSGRTSGAAAKLDPAKLSNAEYRKARQAGKI